MMKRWRRRDWLAGLGACFGAVSGFAAADEPVGETRANPRGDARAEALPDLVAAVRPSVVAVGTFRPTDSPRFGFRGSGFAVLDGRLIITNAHVLPTEPLKAEVGERMMVAIPGARRGQSEMRAARIAAVHPRVDLALLEIVGAPLPALRLAHLEAREGQRVALMGYPIGSALGLNPVVHQGIVSAVVDITEPARTASQLDERAVQQLRAGAFTVYQLDATAYPGNSGGPLISTQTGEVLGIVNMVLVKSSRESALSSPTGISYAIPAVHAVELIRNRAHWVVGG